MQVEGLLARYLLSKTLEDDWCLRSTLVIITATLIRTNMIVIICTVVNDWLEVVVLLFSEQMMYVMINMLYLVCCLSSCSLVLV